MNENAVTILPKYFSSKEATFILGNEDSRSWWFDFNDPIHNFFIIDYLPLNSPSLEVSFSYANKIDGHRRARDMVDYEGWHFLKGEELLNKGDVA